MNASPPLLVLLAAGPGDAGAEALLVRALERAREGRSVDILLSHDGLAWAGDGRLERVRRMASANVGVCSRQARDAGWTLDDAPEGVAWSALIAWVRQARDAEAVWTALP
ncbi:MAG: hypothetical protein QNJ98_09065 [Planctomycetota bacterium]|nr:hypothetical protein [Planctomycetota bacterium]